MVSGAISLSSSEFFSPFPHGTGPLSVSREYLALPDGPGRFAQDSSCPALLRIPLCMKILRAGGSHPLRPDFPDGHARLSIATARSYNPGSALTPPVWALPRSLATTGGIIVYFLFLRVLRCFSSPRSPHDICHDDRLMAAGLSHSEIRGSKVICTLPRLIAAYHVLHRLREPRHPPYALICFSFKTHPLQHQLRERLFQLCTLTLCSLLFCLCQYVKDRLSCLSRTRGE